MTTYTIPTRTDVDHYVEQVDLDGVAYSLELAWNYRDEAWFLSISDDDGPIVSGIRVVADTPLLQFVPGTRKPLGNLMALDTSRDGLDPGLTELGERVRLTYQAATE